MSHIKCFKKIQMLSVWDSLRKIKCSRQFKWMQRESINNDAFKCHKSNGFPSVSTVFYSQTVMHLNVISLMAFPQCPLCSIL